MTFEEKLKKVKTRDDNTSLMISPRMIKRGDGPVKDDETLALYSHMDDNTKEFAEQVITKLVSIANYFERDSQIPIQFGLLLYDNYNSLAGYFQNPEDFIFDNKNKIIAIYAYPVLVNGNGYLDDYYYEEDIQGFAYIYLNFEQLLSIFDKSGIKYSIDLSIDHDIDYFNNDDLMTKFIFSYTPEKKEEKDGIQKLKRKKIRNKS